MRTIKIVLIVAAMGTAALMWSMSGVGAIYGADDDGRAVTLRVAGAGFPGLLRLPGRVPGASYRRDRRRAIRRREGLPMTLATRPSFTSEDDLQSWLESTFEDHGWTAIREVSPRTENVRADLIVQHTDYGWFGIETKIIGKSDGAKIADAHHQITRKYRGKRFIGNRINCWVVCPYFKNDSNGRGAYTREMFCRHGIGYFNVNWSTLRLDFSYSHGWAKVPIGGGRCERHAEKVDIDKIRDLVAEKMEVYDYR